MGRPLSVFTLSEAEEETLRSLARRRTTAQALALRARIVLACAAGDPNQVVARKLGVTPQTVCKWRARFVAQRLDGLHDEPSGRTALDRRCQGRGGDRRNPGDDAAGHHSLELARDG